MGRGPSKPDRTVPVDDPLLTAAEVAEMLGVTERWVLRGYLPYIEVGPQLVRFRKSDVLAFIESNRQPARNIA